MLAGVVLLGAVVAEALPAQTTGYLLPCSAGSVLGRGCTTLTGPSDAATLLANPAGLAWGGARALSLSGAAFLPTMEYSNAANATIAGENNVYPLPAVFYADRARGNWTLGVGLQTLGGMGADYTLTHAVLGPNQRYHSKVGLMKGGIAVAVRPAPQFSIGAMVGAIYGQLEFATPYSLNPQLLAGLAGLAQDPDYGPLLAGFTEATAYAELNGLSGFAPAATVSAEYRPTPDVAFALTYTAPATLTMGGGTGDMDMNTQFGLLYQGMVAAKGGDQDAVNAQLASFGIDLAAGMATGYAAEVDFGIPQTVTLAAGFRPAERWSVGVDVGWINYKSAFDDMPLRMAEGSNANINILVNGDPTDGAFATAWPLESEDSWVARGGVEFAASQALSLRGGFIYGTNPIPSNALFTIFPAIVEQAATVGAGYRVGRTQVNLAWAHTFPNTETASATHLVASEYAGSTSKVAENMLSLGLSWVF
jgi:long-subunit fatty acid transport protein